MTDFWPPREIYFSSQQVIWLIKNMDLLHDGRWPSDYRETGFTGGSGKKSQHHAYFENSAEVIAELDWRLACTGVDGKLLVSQILGELILDREALDALKYVSGWERKTLSYSAWRKQERYRIKMRKRLPKVVRA